MKYLLLVLLGMAACKSHPRAYQVKLQDGSPGYRLDCDKTIYSNQECMDEVSHLCSKGAVVMDDANNGRNTIVRCSQ